MSKLLTRQYKKPSPAIHVVYGRDINIGYATLKHDVQKGSSGWALPGRGFTSNSDKAATIAMNIHNMIARSGGLPKDWMSKRGAA